MLVFLLGKFMRKVFFGQLRAAEMEVQFSVCSSFSSLAFHECLLLFVIGPISTLFDLLFNTVSISLSAPGMQ